jgi:valyl-tRNA synthetase
MAKVTIILKLLKFHVALHLILNHKPMQLAAKYNPIGVEDKWYAYWMKHRLFHSEPDTREPYTVVIPPPNVTGVLHMGHMLNNTIQDVLVRRARMKGKNACWIPGTDHASIATEAKVVAKLAAEGVSKTDLSREQFLTHAWEWTEKHGGIILEQLKKLGASCDWERTNFTMNEAYSQSVIRVFVDLYNKGKIYRGVRMVNWDPQALTAVSDEEVIYKEQQGKLYYIRYKITSQSPPTLEGGDGAFVVVATTRPETIMGDTAVAINPNNPKTAHLKGKTVIVPLINREIPVIEDEYVDMEFGTGCLKVTPAHDINDYLLGEKHHLETIDIFNDNGTLNDNAQIYVGQDRFAVRRRIEKDLAAAGLLEKTENYTHKVGCSERTDAVIEPKLSTQWFVKMAELAAPALASVVNDDVRIVPAKFKNTYRHWMENIKDWCISRQLWWGHRIPAWYIPGGGFVVAPNETEALAIAQEKTKNPALSLADLTQESDCLDTWFSSWLWPLSVFDAGVAGAGGRQPNADLRYYYPTNDLVTAPEILFFWVARMIMAGHEFMHQIPFRNVYLTGIVRDKLGRKMSKSLGNSPDPIELMNKYGADGVRMGMLLTSPAGNDLPFDESLCEQGRNFCNKIWNAFRLVKGWQTTADAQPHGAATEQRQAVEWFDHELRKAIAEIDDDFDKYRLSEALMKVYKLFWDDFCAWYLEIIKPQAGHALDDATLDATLRFFDTLLRLLHPFMPFISEEIWQQIDARRDGESIMCSRMPEAGAYDGAIIESFAQVKEITTALRALRQANGISPKTPLPLYGKSAPAYADVLAKTGNLASFDTVGSQPEGATPFRCRTTEYFVRIARTVDVEAELAKLGDDLAYQQKFRAAVAAKLGNDNFVQHAPPQVIALERKKQADAEARISAIETQIHHLKEKR